MLELASLPSERLPEIINICTALDVLCLKSLKNCDIANRLAIKCEGTLQSLTIQDQNDMQPLHNFLKRCGATLKSLDVTCEILGRLGSWECPLLLIASTCTQLNELTLEAQRASVDCRAVLSAIIKHKLRLKLLKLIGGWCNQSDAVWFKQLSRDHQLLPVPRLVYHW